MEYQKILMGLLSKAYKLDDGTIGEILNAENADEKSVISKILELDTQRVDKLKTSGGKDGTFQDGYAKAKKEVLSDFEKQLKETFETESEKTGLDLITEILTAKTSEAGKKGQLTDDDVKKHPVYQAAEKAFKKQLTEKETEYKTKLSEVESAAKKAQTFSSVKDNALAILEGLNPIYAKNPKVATTIKNQFLNELQGFEFERQADGSWLVTKDGKVVEDGHGHSKSFEDIIKETSESYFEFQENNGGQNAGNENKDNGSGGNVTVPKFKNQAEADAYAANESIPLEQRIKALDEYAQAQ